mmetsp:Transcript_5145/g.12585  ORF Transcript_5145/g.12585 Transcript_5145/m.12585 type:complete len:164 (-) Transcript_5145:1404-1895(-)
MKAAFASQAVLRRPCAAVGSRTAVCQRHSVFTGCAPLIAVRPVARRVQGDWRMGLFGLGFGEVGVIAAIALFVFGPGKLTEMGRGAGGLAGGLKKATSEFQEALEESMQEADAEIEAKKKAKQEAKGGDESTGKEEITAKEDSAAKEGDAAKEGGTAKEETKV